MRVVVGIGMRIAKESVGVVGRDMDVGVYKLCSGRERR